MWPWIKTCAPLFDWIFREDSESVLGLVKFDHFTGQMYVKPGVTVQIWQKPPRINESWHLTPCSIVFFETISNMCLVWSNSVISSVKCIDESSHVTHFSIATYEKIPNLCLIWSNSIILSVKCTSNWVLLVRNVKSPQITWIMSYGPLYHCLFGEDNEFVPSLTFFGILWKNGIEQGVTCHDSSILGDVCHIWPC